MDFERRFAIAKRKPATLVGGRPADAMQVLRESLDFNCDSGCEAHDARSTGLRPAQEDGAGIQVDVTPRDAQELAEARSGVQGAEEERAPGFRQCCQQARLILYVSFLERGLISA